MQLPSLDSKTAAMVQAGILAPTSALLAGESLSDAQKRHLWARHMSRQREAAATMAQLRRDWLTRNR